MHLRLPFLASFHRDPKTRRRRPARRRGPVEVTRRSCCDGTNAGGWPRSRSARAPCRAARARRARSSLQEHSRRLRSTPRTSLSNPLLGSVRSYTCVCGQPFDMASAPFFLSGRASMPRESRSLSLVGSPLAPQPRELLRAWRECGVLFAIEGGQFVWSGVRVGHRRQLQIDGAEVNQSNSLGFDLMRPEDAESSSDSSLDSETVRARLQPPSFPGSTP